MLQPLQDHSVCSSTDSQHSLVRFLLFLVSVVMVRLQRSHHLDEILESLFYFFIPGVQSNEDSKTLQA